MKKYSPLKARFDFLLTVLLTSATIQSFSQVADHTCGAVNVHNPAVAYGQVSDIDGNMYKTVVIDSLVWFAENLKVTRFQNGDSIPHVSDSASWSGLTVPGMCSYKNDTAFDCPYGKLYNFYVASDTRNPCPSGWRVPSLTDFNNLINHFDPASNGGAPSNLPNTAGGYLKSTGFAYWQSPNTSATNLSGFSAIPNGGRNNAGVFSFTNNSAASFWYSSQVGPGMGFFLQLPYNQEFAVRNAYFSGYGCCIRCVTEASTLNLIDLEKAQFDVFPNPASETIQLNVNRSLVGKEYLLSDLAGRLIQKNRVLSEQTTLSITALPSGMYLLSFPQTKAEVVKLIKH